MPRIAGNDIPEQKKVRFALRYIYGVGLKTADELILKTNIDPDKRARDLTGDEVNRIQRALDTYLVEGNLRRSVRDNIDRLKRTRSYRGLRHIAGLPVRGQRTRTNGRTKKGKRRTVGALSKDVAAKLETAQSDKG